MFNNRILHLFVLLSKRAPRIHSASLVKLLLLKGDLTCFPLILSVAEILRKRESGRGDADAGELLAAEFDIFEVSVKHG